MLAENLEQQMAKLNAEQLEAVQHVDGSLLVIAGPGTGKTQLLSLRAANILATRDVQPKNILCLTFTEAGAEAMQKRLVQLIGRDAYGIQVSTFHGFASLLRMRWPEAFSLNAASTLASELRKSEIVNGILNSADVENPIYAGKRNGVNAKLESVLAFIGQFKRSGLTTQQFREINQQTLSFLNYAKENSSLLEMVNSKVPGSRAAKEEFCAAFEEEVMRVCSMAPHSLREPVVQVPGIYVPYAKWLAKVVAEAELIDEDGKTAGYQNLREALFLKADKGRVLKDMYTAEAALAVADVYDEYQEALAAEGLYDFDDMILEAIAAIENSPSLQQQLCDKYKYIQVDEFQDTNGAQMRIMQLLAGGGPNPNLMAVCDDDQAIMRFQGATIECIQQFEETWHPKNIVLKTNYRSLPSIVELGKSVAEQIENRLPASSAEKDVRAFKSEEQPLVFEEHVFVSSDAEAYEMAKSIKKRIDSGYLQKAERPEEAIAVIAPKHALLQRFIPYLNIFDVPFGYKQTANVFNIPHMQTLLAIMRATVALSMGRRKACCANIPMIVASPELGVTHSQCIDFAIVARNEHSGDWLEALKNCKIPSIAHLYETLIEWAAQAQSAPVRQLVFEMYSPIAAYYKANQENDAWGFAEFNAGVRALLNFVEDELRIVGISSSGAESGKAARAINLVDIVERMDELERYDVAIDASISLGRDDAVRLLSAHGSKGLEFDCVYMLDADDNTWHSTRSSTTFFTQNMLVGNTKDEDDARRLLFVALTRAKREIEFYRAGGATLRELASTVETKEHVPSPEQAAEIIEAGWAQNFLINTEELGRKLVNEAAPKHLSVSALNNFVEYREGAVNSLEFPQNRMLFLPMQPNPITEFGTIVHAFLEDYVNLVVKGNSELEDIASLYERQIEHMDFRKDEVDGLLKRYKRIVNAFVPWLNSNVEGELATEQEIRAVTESGVPIRGFMDLLLIDRQKKTVQVFDYKTGFSYPKGKPSTEYERQLLFYKLLIESSAEYEGFTVTKCVDVYVEPERGTKQDIHEPVESVMQGQSLEHLDQLITVVWNRIQTGRFDTSGFETSNEKAQAIAANVKKDGTPAKRTDKRLMQTAYEEWLLQNS